MEPREHALQQRLSGSAVLLCAVSARLAALSPLGSALPFAPGRL